jgi:hypothetical protein
VVVDEEEEKKILEVEERYERKWFDRLKKRDEIISKGAWWL